MVAKSAAAAEVNNHNNRPTSAATSVPPPPPPTTLEKLLPFLRRPDERFAKYPTSWFTQFGVLTQRAWVNQLRNPADATSRLMLAVWVSACAGLIAYGVKLEPSTAG